jgi:parvulin-like peptidyl-prolyl isomerase
VDKNVIFSLFYGVRARGIKPVLCGLLLGSTLQAALPTFPVRDTIVAIVYGQEGCEIITLSDVQRPGLGGQMRSLDDLIFEFMVYLDALKHKIIIDDDAVDKYLQMIQRQNNLTLAQLEESFIQAGFTPAEGRQQLRVMQTVNTMMGLKVRDNLVVSRKDVERYYNTYPEASAQEYVLEYAMIPDTGNPDQEADLIALAHATDPRAELEWTKPFVISSADLVEEKSYIKTLTPGQISRPVKIEGGYELYRLVEKKESRLLTLDERYHAIVETLRKPKMRELQQEYKDALTREYTVVRMRS